MSKKGYLFSFEGEGRRRDYFTSISTNLSKYRNPGHPIFLGHQFPNLRYRPYYPIKLAKKYKNIAIFIGKWF